jgi:hypothetical protein
MKSAKSSKTNVATSLVYDGNQIETIRNFISKVKSNRRKSKSVGRYYDDVVIKKRG